MCNKDIYVIMIMEYQYAIHCIINHLKVITLSHHIDIIAPIVCLECVV